MPKHVVIPGDGDPCPRCGRPTQIREHPAITAKHLAQPFYYSRFFYCLHGDCKTTFVMPPRYQVWNEGYRKKHHWKRSYRRKGQKAEAAPVFDDPNDIPERPPWWADDDTSEPAPWE